VGAGVYPDVAQALLATAPAELPSPPAQPGMEAYQTGYARAVEKLLELYQS